MKITFTKLFALLAFIIIQENIMAQPFGVEHHGCHHTKSKIEMLPLTVEEEIEMQQSALRSDTIDILNYNITLDARDFSGQTITASCEITFSPKMDGITYMQPLDLLDFTVDSVVGASGHLVHDFDGLFLNVQLPTTMNTGEVGAFTVYYHGQPTPAASGFGGFVFEGDIAYNLGIGLGANPYNYGRGWFPCFDNFVERATYDLNIISPAGKRGYGIGTFLEQIDLGNDENMRRYRFDQPLPTYLVGVAVGPYTIEASIHTGAFGDVPITLIGKPSDVNAINDSFQHLGTCIDAIEYWFGPYAWERVGFVMTNVGAMEHCTSIAYPVSIATNGATANQNRLMAHELAHHWWGNVLTLSSPANMWIKEGNAEYSAHLFFEYAFGNDVFVDAVKDNHLNEVLIKAHTDDDGFHQLSGIPYEQTYGTHTYNKGASMMHNLRGYMGDDLFRQGMTAMLEVYEYQSINAEQFRDHLIANTGLDLHPFFDAWIFAPGYANYEISAIDVSQSGGNYDVEIEIQQKLRAAPQFHNDVPLEITFFDENWNAHTEAFMVSGEYTLVDFMVPFEPVMQVLNDANRLNLARSQNRFTAYEAGNVDTEYSDFLALSIIEMNPGDSAMINVVHHWTAPDDGPEFNLHNLKMSSTHYWTFSGIVPESGFKMKGTTRYKGGTPTALDYDLVNMTDDSLILVWREEPENPWIEYPYYRKQTAGDFIKIDTLLMGDYAFANGVIETSTSEVENLIDLSIYPNPTSDILYVEGALNEVPENAFIELYDWTGKLVFSKNMGHTDRFLHEMIDLVHLASGSYLLKFRDLGGYEFAKPQKVMLLN